ncbi:MarR family transcriptional regulator [Actinospica durhamensis]|uniref:MarR family transcriptional regulator n=1 Tax=Actinospica durhamensis TaxID=1508375 RepID=A0A941IRS7_9ACTN|nr:MarR family transcriptional regulator [Actinospica durhamensis]MBR7837689.1 MarR family transcriptional regulator [Actinospica durhamensis]
MTNRPVPQEQQAVVKQQAVDDRRLLALPALLLGGAGTLMQAIHEGVEQRGFTGVRPAHGFAFVRLAPDGASIAEVAEHLGVTKQAASQLVEELLRRGYVRVEPHPRDARAKLVTLTERGWACTRAADEAALEAVRAWAGELGVDRVEELAADLARVARPGRLRPLW